MRIAEVSTSLPLLAKGEPGCDAIDTITETARAAILAACMGSLRRAGFGWYGPDKRRPFHRRTVRALIKRRLLCSPDPNTARLTKRGRWLARTICSEIAGHAFATVTAEDSCHTVA